LQAIWDGQMTVPEKESLRHLTTGQPVAADVRENVAEKAVVWAEEHLFEGLLPVGLFGGDPAPGTGGGAELGMIYAGDFFEFHGGLEGCFQIQFLSQTKTAVRRTEH